MAAPPRISRDDIADAGLAIGLSSVKMKAVVERLGVGHSSLYRHVKGRDDLIFLARGRALSKLDCEQDSPDWRDFLRSRAKTVWALCDAYPGLASALRAMKTIPPRSSPDMPAPVVGWRNMVLPWTTPC
ncbi:TetR/AcrR family transcriptional regulator [Rhodovulum sulfidophilum]|nr:TetR/AcrR family transcriptional regulator [Rhodovulum sulfidophilum]